MAFPSISTDLPKRFADSFDCSIAVRLSKWCASSKTVTCIKSALSLPEVIRYSCSCMTSMPIISDFVSVDPTRLKSTITFLSKRSESVIASLVKISPFNPLVSERKRVISDPLYAPLFSAS